MIKNSKRFRALFSAVEATLPTRRWRPVVEHLEQRALLSASLAAPFDVTQGNNPYDIVVADLNGDGRADIITADRLDQSVSISYGGVAPGTFGAAVHHAVGHAISFVVAGDLDGDLDLDLVTVGNLGQFSVLNATGVSGGAMNYTNVPATIQQNVTNEVALRDMNNDGKLDLIIAGVHLAPGGATAQGVQVYLGNGDRTFAAAPVTFGTGALTPGNMVVADFNGNGLLDLAFNGGTTFKAANIVLDPFGASSSKSVTSPVNVGSMAAGDFNGDGKVDLVLTGTNSLTSGKDGSEAIIYLQNNGSGSFLNPVTIQNGKDHNKAEAADIDGDGNLDVVTLADGAAIGVLQGLGDGRFVFSAVNSPVASFPFEVAVGDINADGKADVIAANSTSDRVSVHVNNSTAGVPAGTPSPFPTGGGGGGGGGTTPPSLSASLGVIKLPAVFVNGDKGTAQVVIANSGGIARGKVNVALYASTDGTIDGGDTLLNTGATLANKQINIGANKSAKLTGKFVAPAALANGTYFILAKVTSVNVPSTTEFNSTASPGTYAKVTSFGQVGARRNVKLFLNDGDGTLVTYALLGPGTGEVTNNGADITLSGTTAGSRLVVTTRATAGSNGETAVANLTINGAIGSIVAKGVQVTGSLTVGDVRTILLADLLGGSADVAVSLGGGTPVVITLDEVANANITSSAGIKLLKARQWTDTAFSDDTITAPFVTSLQVPGEFAANLVLSGSGAPGGMSILSAKIGTLSSALWSVAAGNVGAVAVAGSVNAGWVGNVAGNVKSLAVRGGFGGDLVAANIASFSVLGDVLTARVRAGGTFGVDNIPGTVDDTFAAGSLNKVLIRGAVTGSRFFAGTDNAGTVVAAGLLGSVIIGGAADLTSEFVAATLPVTATIGGVRVETATDARFAST